MGALDWSIIAWCLLVLAWVMVVTGLYTVLGGLRAVAYTEALQTVILVVGSLLVTICGLRIAGKIKSPFAPRKLRHCATFAERKATMSRSCSSCVT